jgi:hypothetical protein
MNHRDFLDLGGAVVGHHLVVGRLVASGLSPREAEGQPQAIGR